jgi:type VI secretion system protein ImpK
MSSSPASPVARPRTSSLALAFQEVFTVVLRTRFNFQQWDRADRMRAAASQMIATAANNAHRTLGYSKEATEMALYAVIGFLDESVLNLKDPVFAEWGARPLQEEMFGTQLAGEIFFRHIAELLNRPESTEVADILEVHCLCLLLGFRGRYAYGDASEVQAILRRIREKIVRIRGPFVMTRPSDVPAVSKRPAGDRWVRRLAVTAVVFGIACLVAFLTFHLLLAQSATSAAQAADASAHHALRAAIKHLGEASA